MLFVGHYVNADETEGTSIHLHPDAESFDAHLRIAGRAIDQGARTVRVKRIGFYGEPNLQIVEQSPRRSTCTSRAGWRDSHASDALYHQPDYAALRPLLAVSRDAEFGSIAMDANLTQTG